MTETPGASPPPTPPGQGPPPTAPPQAPPPLPVLVVPDPWPPWQTWPPPVARLITPPRRRVTWDHPGLLMALLGASFVVALVLGLLVFLSRWRPGMLVAELAAFLVPAVVYVRLTRARWEGAFRLRPRVAVGLVPAVLCAGGIWACGAMLTGWVVQFLSPDETAREMMERMWGPFARCRTSPEWTWTILGMVVAAAVTEEMLFRGVIQRGLSHRWGRWPALLTTAAIFAAFHLQAVSFPVLFVLGLVFGWLYQRSGSLWPGIVAHAANNLLAILAFNAPEAADRVAEHLGGLGVMGISIVMAGGGVALFGALLRRVPPSSRAPLAV